MKIRFALCLIALSAAWQTHAADTGEDLARQWCANCHTVSGNSTQPMFPRLAGQQYDYLLQQLQAFRNKSRHDRAAHDYMWGMTAALDDATIEGLARYFSTQKPEPNPAPVDDALANAGKQLYQNGNPAAGTPACASCHGANAEGTAIAPRLAGQHAEYLTKQLHVFGTNQRPAAVAMQEIIKTLKESDIQAVTAYLQSVR
ncbi:MAG: cytochrome c4 [Paludibacterium sp.]|uniref:c-type cytochrome n=1 Tax=Paludibacterium sp. TaxID=1917523 RepID=UPI0025CBF199|nr:c-type cytochrome [Paludibacterium sp.]MBV8049139.1 cytochrome c4 [Paludibacterium sp.]MBV8646976.1 cytochrome c4 [Paludibacterium sp.]